MNGRKTYRRTASGIEITDSRQTTNGAIVPNYVVDLYLPIIGYDGLGILTMLYRLANHGKIVVDLNKYARSGRMGFRAFNDRLEKLEKCKIIRVTKPTGGNRVKHFRTVIELLDPPTSVPEEYAEVVLDRAITQWLLQDQTPPEMPNDISEVSNDISENAIRQFHEVPDSISKGCTLIDVTSDDESETPPPDQAQPSRSHQLLPTPTQQNGMERRPSQSRPPGGVGESGEVVADLSTRKSPTPQQQFFQSVCDALGWDHRILDKSQQGQVAQLVGKLQKAGYSKSDVDAFRARWFTEDWRGQKGEFPTPKLLTQEIGKLKARANSNDPDAHLRRASQLSTEKWRAR